MYRRYIAFVYLCETAHRHATESSKFVDMLGLKLCLFSPLPLMTRQSCYYLTVI